MEADNKESLQGGILDFGQVSLAVEGW